MDALNDIYEDPSSPGSFGGVDALYREARKRGLRVTKNEVKDWLSGKLSYTLHKPARKRFKRNRTTVFYVNELFQLDLIDLRSLRRYNDGATFILTVIDVFSKMAFAKILRDKRADTVLRAFTDILRESGRTPTKVETDQGLEFTNTKFQRELEKRGITFFTTYSENKASVVERFNRTLKTRMWVFFTNNNTYRYVDVLPDLLKAYNSSPHSSIKRSHTRECNRRQ